MNEKKYTIKYRLVDKNPIQTMIRVNSPILIVCMKQNSDMFTLTQKSKMYHYFIYDGDIGESQVALNDIVASSTVYSEDLERLENKLRESKKVCKELIDMGVDAKFDELSGEISFTLNDIVMALKHKKEESSQ